MLKSPGLEPIGCNLKLCTFRIASTNDDAGGPRYIRGHIKNAHAAFATDLSSAQLSDDGVDHDYQAMAGGRLGMIGNVHDEYPLRDTGRTGGKPTLH